MTSQLQLFISEDSIPELNTSEVKETSCGSIEPHHVWAPVALIASMLIGLFFWGSVAVYLWL